MKPSKAVKVLKWRLGRKSLVPDQIASEEPLGIRVNGKDVLLVMRTPGQDKELAAGFLYTEGLIKFHKDIARVVGCQNPKSEMDENVINLFLAPKVRFDPAGIQRHFYASSSCGVCGKASLEAARKSFRPVRSTFRISRKVLSGLPAKLRKVQKTFEKTGGLHASALFDPDGKMLVLREDVGRHNALDKIVGWGLFKKRLPFDNMALLVSGRVSFEIMQKALAAGIPLVAAIGAPSSLAVEMAQENGQTLAGFLRDEGMNVYTNAHRIV